MTRINTNVSSLLAQNTLQRSAADLQQSLTRLSTGLRINAGKDDPAGLIASEALRADMTSIDRAITNSTRANLMIGTADSALGQVSSLLNDVRGLVVEAASTGSMSAAQIEANQLQVDSSLEAINRIAQTTTFQGRRLLDGSLAFTTTAHTVPVIRDLQIDQASLGTTGQVAVSVEVSEAAEVAEITNEGAFSAGTNATFDVNLGYGKAIESENVTGAYISISTKNVNDDAAGVSIVFQQDDAHGTTANAVVTYNGGNTVTVAGNWSNASWSQSANQNLGNIADRMMEVTAFSERFEAHAGNGAALSGNMAAQAGNASAGAFEARTLEFTAESVGADYNSLRVNVRAGATTGAAYDADSQLVTVTISNNTSAVETMADITTTLNTDLEGHFDVALNNATTSGNAAFTSGHTNVMQTTNTGSTGGVSLLDNLVISVGGASGREVFTFQQGATVNHLAAAFNLVSDATGVVASHDNDGKLVLNSTDYGSRGLVDTEVISEGLNGLFEASWVDDKSRGTGKDIVATVNGVTAKGDGNTLSMNTATLDLTITVDTGYDGAFVFDITGGGALFQLGPDVVGNQQARLGISSLNTTKMGGPSGRLYELASGGDKTLSDDPNAAYRVVSEVISKVATLRGRLGAFQRTTVETNIASLTDSLVNLTDAESAIRDADFAKESSALTRAQILVQSGTAVLSIANSTPQSVLSLLR